MGWASALYGRSGVAVGVEGAVLLPLSYETVDAWARLTGRRLEPHEVDALMALNAAMLNPEEPEAEEPASLTPVQAWPTRKPGVTPVLIHED